MEVSLPGRFKNVNKLMSASPFQENACKSKLFQPLLQAIMILFSKEV